MTMDPDTWPECIRALPRDRRGYPIPYVVLVDADGVPDFVVNDAAKTLQVALERLCAICGEGLPEHPWFGGGPGNALLNGDVAVYIDGPMHRECLHFALRVCPHLAGKLLKPVALKAITDRLDRQGIRTVDNTVIPGTPPVFVAVQAWAYSFEPRSFDHQIYAVRKPFRKTEYWTHGAMLPRDEGERLAKRWARELKAKL